jgi:transcriptional regulator with XRE-family HTH domain
MERIGATLRALRRQHKLSLRDVEQRSEKFAGQTGNESFRISASWLNRLEREEHELTASRVIVLAHIYGVGPGRLLSLGQQDDATPQETGLVSIGRELSAGFYRWGIIGSRDKTLSPLLPGGSMVKIDTRKRMIEPARSWASEFRRPIYFLRYKRDYFCGWCEFDSAGSLTLIPHPLSSSPRQTWTDRSSLEIIGRVVAVTLLFE